VLSKSESCKKLLLTRLFVFPSARNKSIIFFFNVCGSVHRKYIPVYIQQDATLHSLFIFGNCSTCFGLYHHPSSGAHTTVSTASDICHTVTAICRYRVRVGPVWLSDFLFNRVTYVFLLLCMFCSVYPVFIVPTGTLRLSWVRFSRAFWHGYVLHEGITYKSRVPYTSQMTSRLLRHTAAAMPAHNVLRNSYNTRPLLCARIKCYVTVITHARCYARA
jgi:hypothetical protein